MEGVFTNLRRGKREKERKSTKTRRQKQKASTKLTVAPWFMYSLEELGPPQVRGPIAIPILRDKPRIEVSLTAVEKMKEREPNSLDHGLMRVRTCFTSTYGISETPKETIVFDDRA